MSQVITWMQAASGVALGGAFALSGYLIHEQDVPVGYYVGTGASVVTSAAMAWRWYKTRRLVPAGLLAPLALSSAGYHGYKAYSLKMQMRDEALQEAQRA
jgi:uncharacterized membrane protein (UPF0136 family)